MVTYNENGKLIEVPLILNDPQVTKQIADLRDKLEQLQGASTPGRLKGLREGPDGQWLGVFDTLE